MLWGAVSRVGPLPPRLREGAHLKRYKWVGAKLKREGGGESVNNTTPANSQTTKSNSKLLMPFELTKLPQFITYSYYSSGEINWSFEDG